MNVNYYIKFSSLWETINRYVTVEMLPTDSINLGLKINQYGQEYRFILNQDVSPYWTIEIGDNITIYCTDINVYPALFSKILTLELLDNDKLISNVGFKFSVL